MTLRIKIFGEKVQVFCNDKPLESERMLSF